MTISSTTRKAGPFTGNNVTVAFPFTFKVFLSSDLLVVQTDLSGVQTTKVLTTDYTVALNANQDSNPGGTVTMLVAPPTGFLLTIGSQVPQTQAVVLTNTGGFFPTVMNDEFDKLTILIQQMNEQLNRAVYIPFSSSASTALPTPSGNTLLAWNAAGTAIINVSYSAAGAIVSPAMVPVVNAATLALGRTAFGLGTTDDVSHASVTALAGGVNPSTAASRAQLWSASNSPALSFVDSTRTADNKIVEFTWSAGILRGRFTNDAYGSVLNWLTVAGGQALGVTSLALAAGAGTVTLTSAGIAVASVVSVSAAADQAQLMIRRTGAVNNPGLNVRANETGNAVIFDTIWSNTAPELQWAGNGTTMMKLSNIGDKLSLLVANASIYVGTAASYGTFANDDGSTYIQIYGHTHGSAGNINMSGNVGVTGAFTASAATATLQGLNLSGGGAPALWFSGDATSGLYRPAANQVGMFISGAQVWNTTTTGLLMAANKDIQMGRANIALGGGAAPTVGTIGGSGPATAAQNSWIKLLDSTGAAIYVPVWK